ncbi:hypothetical protein HIM_08535 [Hirsutella minnesotensis 3608]|uniref:6-phosphogluconolactonase n=1 Tax=Hirsutella minnesotensis 3608 TaxID=1043627 RepID=A0A0F7ZMI2_9HYPO|nr:hypothetical protein HIM_08535 [Hirsutella minnesotensis 3608]
MKLQLLARSLLATAALAVPHGSSSLPARRDDGGSITRILLSGPGGVMLATVAANGTGIDIRARHNATAGTDPSWVVFRAPDAVFAVDENGAELSALKVDLQAFSIAPASKFAGSPGIVHLALARDGKRLLGAAYGNGSVDAWDVENPAAVKKLAHVALTGKPGPNKERQAASHPHQVVLDSAGRYAAVPDLGYDAVHIIDAGDDAFKVVNSVAVEPAGCGPRHAVFYPPTPANATHLIVLCEIANLINVYSVLRDADAGAKGLDLRLVQSVSSFGPGVPHPKAAAGEIALGPGGKDVYVSNRLTEDKVDHIAHFRVGNNGTAACDPKKGDAKKGKTRRRRSAAAGFGLQFVGQQPCQGTNPRMFSLTADGALVFVANGKGEAGISGLERNKDTGVLGPAPLWSIPMTTFGENGPQYVQQIQ